jgi:hypothetical protein
MTPWDHQIGEAWIEIDFGIRQDERGQLAMNLPRGGVGL